MSNSNTIVNPQFLTLYPVDLTITRKELSLSLGNFVVTDANGNVVFRVKPIKFSLRDRRSLLDAADSPILSFQKRTLVTTKSMAVALTDHTPFTLMHKKYTVYNIAIDTFDVIVNPIVDHAFIVTLIVILYEINEEKDAAI
ncbi:LURP-one-related 15-like protein [Tanacetum coccineum]